MSTPGRRCSGGDVGWSRALAVYSLTTSPRESKSDGVTDPHTYGLSEWQDAQLAELTVEQLTAEHAATTVDTYRAKVEAEFKRRHLDVPK